MTETDGSHARQREYAYGNYIDETLMKVEDSCDVYYLHDHLFSPVALVDDSATVLERYEYDAYGKVYFFDSSFNLLGTQTSGHGNPVTFTGQRLDSLDSHALLVMYYKNRYYLVDIGRFAQRDPFGERDGTGIIKFALTGAPLFPRQFDPAMQYQDGMNVYEYVRSAPLNHVDATGLGRCGECLPPRPPFPNAYPVSITWGTSTGRAKPSTVKGLTEAVDAIEIIGNIPMSPLGNSCPSIKDKGREISSIQVLKELTLGLQDKLANRRGVYLWMSVKCRKCVLCTPGFFVRLFAKCKGCAGEWQYWTATHPCRSDNFRRTVKDPDDFRDAVNDCMKDFRNNPCGPARNNHND